MKKRQTARVHYNNIFKLQLLSNAHSDCSSSCPGEAGNPAQPDTPGRQRQSSSGHPALSRGSQTAMETLLPTGVCPAHTRHLIHHTAHHSTSPQPFPHGGWFVFTSIRTQSLFQAICGVLAKNFPEHIFVRSNTSVSTLSQ